MNILFHFRINKLLFHFRINKPYFIWIRINKNYFIFGLTNLIDQVLNQINDTLFAFSDYTRPSQISFSD